MSKEYLLGNEAIARGLLESGVDVATGYPGTPSSEILAALAPYAHINKFHIEWSVNEKVALEVAIGASWAGARSVITMKHVGLNVAADPFMTLSHTGVVGGLVLISADDPFCHSSQNEQDSRMYAKFAKIPCFDPQSPQEAKDMLIYAYEFSEKFHLNDVKADHASFACQVGHRCRGNQAQEQSYRVQERPGPLRRTAEEHARFT